MAKKTLTVHIDSEVLDNFRNYCKLNALKLSAKVELLLKQEMENAKSNPTLVQLFKDILENKRFVQIGKKQDQTHLQYKPKQEVKEVIQGIKEKKQDYNPETKQEQKKHEKTPETKNAPTLDQLRYRKGL